MITLRVTNLAKRYGQQTVFRNLSFTTSSQTVGISGRNGSGKSTLLLCLSRLLKPTAGKISWLQNGNEIPEEKLSGLIGFTAPYIELYDELSAGENLSFLVNLRRSDKPAPDMGRYLQQFDAGTLLEKSWGELSTGERQRIKLAAGCLHDPVILCLDEPGSNLDKKGKQLIADTVDRLKGDNRLILIASNQADELDLCDEIINLDEGVA